MTAAAAGKSIASPRVAMSMTTHVLFEGSPGVLVRTGSVVIEGVAPSETVSAARHAARSADRIELCGGMSVAVAAQVRDAVQHRAEVRLNRYGFESLEQATAYKVAYESGADPGAAAFLYRADQSTPLTKHEDVLTAGVADHQALRERAQEAIRAGAGLIELYGGLGVLDAAIVREATSGAVPVGFVE